MFSKNIFYIYELRLPYICIYTCNSQMILISTGLLNMVNYKNNYYGTSIDSVRFVLAKNKVCLLDVQPHVSEE